MTPTLSDVPFLFLCLTVSWLVYGKVVNSLVTQTVGNLKRSLRKDLEESQRGEEFDFWRLRYHYPAMPLSVFAVCLNELEQRGVVVKLYRVDLKTIIVDFPSVADLPTGTDKGTLSVVVRRV